MCINMDCYYKSKVMQKIGKQKYPASIGYEYILERNKVLYKP
jgi:hypothetical protein